jgi:predicted kinase
VNSVTSQPNAAVEARRQQRAAALAAAAGKVEARLQLAGEPVACPLLVVFSGLPGSGKSYLARQVQPHLAATIIESDFVRRVLFPRPRYTGTESAWVYAVSHALIARLLGRSQSVIFDATNLLERSRQSLCRMAGDLQAHVVIVRTIAPDEVIRQRLLARCEHPDANNHSDATVEVYEKLQLTDEPMRGPHLAIDTTEDWRQSVQRILRECRMQHIACSQVAQPEG